MFRFEDQHLYMKTLKKFNLPITLKPSAQKSADQVAQKILRPRVLGKFIYFGDKKVFIKGVTYGTFLPRPNGDDYPEVQIMERDFQSMAANGFNCVRTYTPPPKRLLDCALKHGLTVMVGLPWEQHVTFLDTKESRRGIRSRMRQYVRDLNKHPAIFCYTIGNEIPPSIIRWYGRARVEHFLKSLYRTVKSVDPEGLVTYVNFPTTEYLKLRFLDFSCFNVYLENKESLNAYLARLQNLADELPLVMAEIGLDSRRNGEDKQAETIGWQVSNCFQSGCAGAFIFSWTDEWNRGGFDIEDWDFGLTTRDRQPKKALLEIKERFSHIPFPDNIAWPKISVVVCSYNGARTIRQNLEAMKKVDYPNFEVIVVNDGSRDITPKIVADFNVHLISTVNMGLSNARNTGYQAATGEIVAYIDDDAFPDPHWLKFLAYTFITTDYAAVGGSNILPDGVNEIADCVDNAPGGPTHVLITDFEAEHIPGCNMAFRKSVLEEVGGFDTRFRIAGDDVDICWKIQERGWKIGFNCAAVVLHHCRHMIKHYWKQQYNYGRAEGMLEDKWPEKYNSAGHIVWQGKIYSKGPTHGGGRSRIYQGVWGTALFQRLYQPAAHGIFVLPLMPEWYLMIAFLGFLTFLGTLWAPLFIVFPLFVGAIVATMFQAFISAENAAFMTDDHLRIKRIQLKSITFFLHLIQPLARLLGRIRHGLTPWRMRGMSKFLLPWLQTYTIWSEQWRAPEVWLGSLDQSLKDHDVSLKRGGEYDRWDLEVHGGLFGAVRLLMAIEEHGGGKQQLRFRLRPKISRLGIYTVLFFAALSVMAYVDKAYLCALILLCISGVSILRGMIECARSKASLLYELDLLKSFQKYIGYTQGETTP